MDLNNPGYWFAIILLTISNLVSQVCCTRDEMFLTPQEALPVLGREGLSGYSALTAQLNLRSDIDGWEEMLYEYKSTTPKVIQQLEVALHQNMLSADQRDLLIDKVVRGSAVGLHALSLYSRTVSLSDFNPFALGGT